MTRICIEATQAKSATVELSVVTWGPRNTATEKERPAVAVDRNDAHLLASLLVRFAGGGERVLQAAWVQPPFAGGAWVLSFLTLDAWSCLHACVAFEED